MVLRRFAAGFMVGLAVVGSALAADDAKPTKADKPEVAAPAEKEAKDKPAAKKEGAEKPAKKAGPQFIRVLRNSKDVPTSLETAVVRYTATEGKYAGCTVDLIGAVHVGDKAYYKKLNKRFADYEALLYELVAKKGTKIPKGGGGGSGHPVGMMQQGMTEVLGLAYQLEEVDYTKKNFVHADMSPKEFDDKMKERGESWMGMMFKMMGQGIAMQAESAKDGESPEMEMLLAMFDSERDLKLKRALAKQMESMETMMAGFEGEDGSTIITERNKAAFKVLADELAEGKKKIGVFYGAGHLADMDERLIKEFGLKRETTEWFVAWDMTGATKKPAKKPAKKADETPAKKAS